MFAFWKWARSFNVSWTHNLNFVLKIFGGLRSGDIRWQITLQITKSLFCSCHNFTHTRVLGHLNILFSSGQDSLPSQVYTLCKVKLDYFLFVSLEATCSQEYFRNVTNYTQTCMEDSTALPFQFFISSHICLYLNERFHPSNFFTYSSLRGRDKRKDKERQEHWPREKKS